MTRPFTLSLLLGLLAVPAFAQEDAMVDRKGVNGKAETDAGMSAYALVTQLAQYGRMNNDAQALATAAQILLDNPADAIEAEMDTETMDDDTDMDDSAAMGEKSGDMMDFSAAALLAEAADLAGDDEALAGVIEGLQARAAMDEKGRLGGALLGVYRVPARSTNTHYLTFRGGQRASISVTGDHDTDLDFYLYDENNNLVASDTDYTDVGYFSFRPLWTGPFRLRVVNLGRVYNEYVLSTN